jgi:hypothetical protein
LGAHAIVKKQFDEDVACTHLKPALQEPQVPPEPGREQQWFAAAADRTETAMANTTLPTNMAV